MVCSVVRKTGTFLESTNYYHSFKCVRVLYKIFPYQKETKTCFFSFVILLQLNELFIIRVK
jgi:hypothetical protein